jgi:acyl-CoA hydrolase
VRYVVTEHGVAYLHGKSIRERAQALIQIADPAFQGELYEYCEQTKWLQRVKDPQVAGSLRSG